VHARHYYSDNNELVEVFVLRYKEQEVYAFVETLMSHAIQFAQTSVLLSQKDSLFLARPIRFHYITRLEEPEAFANEVFSVVASGNVRTNVNQRFALKDVSDAHRALEPRATSGSTVLTI
jgi:NADPH:quinone reductase-like Zn-dependent oxidoreductase